jgi:uncharacterized membrane protein
MSRTTTRRGAVHRLVTPTPLTRAAALLLVLVITATASYLVLQYQALPDLLPVHFNARGAANGWQYRTWARVLLPVAIQTLLGLVLGGISLLLLSRPHGPRDDDAPDVHAAAVAAEAVVTIALVWVSFQAYTAVALVRLWTTARATLGTGYTVGEALGVAASLWAAVRAHQHLGRPAPRPFVPGHWWGRHLYRNAEDPALFVPTRDGRRWTLNFGRPVAGALMGIIISVGVLGPTLLLALALR